MVTITLGLDILAWAPHSMPASQIGPSLLRPALLAQLQSMQALLPFGEVSPFSCLICSLCACDRLCWEKH